MANFVDLDTPLNNSLDSSVIDPNLDLPIALCKGTSSYVIRYILLKILFHITRYHLMNIELFVTMIFRMKTIHVSDTLSKPKWKVTAMDDMEAPEMNVTEKLTNLPASKKTEVCR